MAQRVLLLGNLLMQYNRTPYLLLCYGCYLYGWLTTNRMSIKGTRLWGGSHCCPFYWCWLCLCLWSVVVWTCQFDAAWELGARGRDTMRALFAGHHKQSFFIRVEAHFNDLNPFHASVPTWTVLCWLGYFLFTLAFPAQFQQLWWMRNRTNTVQFGSVVWKRYSSTQASTTTSLK